VSLAHEAAPPIKGFMFDVDGTLLLSDRSLGGYEVLPEAIEVLSALKERRVPFVLLTNGSAYPPAEQAAKLRKVGLPVDDEQMLTPSCVTADLMSRRGIKRVLVLGVRGVGQALAEAGIATVYTGEPGATQVDAVYVGWHPDCAMQDIETACHAVWGGAKLYVASDVPFFATKHGRMIGYSFTIAGAIRRLTKVPAILTGKPSLHALRFVAGKLGVRMREVGIVGDDPVVETLMARRGGATAFAVTTGTTKLEDWMRQPPRRQPHRILTGLNEVLSYAGAPPERAAAG
jgi:4-nitrophenyl phosphatase